MIFFCCWVGSQHTIVWVRSRLIVWSEVGSSFVRSGVGSLLGPKWAYPLSSWKSTHFLVRSGPILSSRKSTQVIFSAFCEVMCNGECRNRRIFLGYSISFHGFLFDSIPTPLASSRRFFIYSHIRSFFSCFQKFLYNKQEPHWLFENWHTFTVFTNSGLFVDSLVFDPDDFVLVFDVDPIDGVAVESHELSSEGIAFPLCRLYTSFFLVKEDVYVGAKDVDVGKVWNCLILDLDRANEAFQSSCRL